jgi:hypothetical protein
VTRERPRGRWIECVPRSEPEALTRASPLRTPPAQLAWSIDDLFQAGWSDHFLDVNRVLFQWWTFIGSDGQSTTVCSSLRSRR